MNDFSKQHRFNAFKWKILNPKRERETESEPVSLPSELVHSMGMRERETDRRNNEKLKDAIFMRIKGFLEWGYEEDG